MTNGKTVDCIGSSKVSPRDCGFVIDPSFVIRHLAFLIGMLIASGCGSQSGPKRIAVYGTVTRDGKSLEHGSISFLPAEGHTGPVANGAISGGKYSFSTENGPTAGPHRVLVGVAPTKGDLARGNSRAPKTEPADPVGGKVKTAGQNRWEFEISVSEDGREQNFKLE